MKYQTENYSESVSIIHIIEFATVIISSFIIIYIQSLISKDDFNCETILPSSPHSSAMK